MLTAVSVPAWLMFYLHKAKFVDAWTMNMVYGGPWTMTGIKLRAYANDSYPSNQLFGVIKRFDRKYLGSSLYKCYRAARPHLVKA